MRRRDLIRSAAVLALFGPVAARAQEAGRVPRVAILDFFPSSASAELVGPLWQGLKEFGYVEGQNIHVEYHSAEQRSERAAALAADIARGQFDVIVAIATPAAHAAKSVTTTIPIVIAVADAVATGLVASLARPGGNVTGVSTSSPDLAGKRLQLLRELKPDLTRVAFLGAANDPNTRTFLHETEAAAKSIGIHLQPLLVTGPEDFESAFAAMKAERAEGLIVQPLFVGHRNRLAELASRHRMPMIGDQRIFAEAGALAAYGVNRGVLFRRPAFYVDRILKGAKPADLPVELPTKFELVINHKTAKALGLTVPSKLLFTADEVID
jgi:putative ABC transport system substrate-binding protein